MVNDASASIRPAVVAGLFYPDDPRELQQELIRAFLAPLGPGYTPTVATTPASRRIIGVVVPHAGYQYSGAAAAWSYAALAKYGRPAAVVLLGVNHHGVGAPLALSPATGWATPLGVLPLAGTLAARLHELAPGVIPDMRAHAQEHSLEVQAPFLQYLFGEIPILPIAISRATHEQLALLGQALAQLARETDLIIVASSDFSHYITQSQAERLDGLALARIVDIDPIGLYTTVHEHEITMCGVAPVTVMLFAAQALGAQSAQMLHYHTSGDVTGDRRQVVGYGAAAIYR